MYIQPDSTIKILHGVPLDTTYEHTIYFETLAAQTQYFMGLTKHTLTDYTYVRHTHGVIKVGIPSAQLYDCNYLMFQNTAFGAKWFYAYIKAVEYISNEVTQITFETDPIQSWFFDFSLDHCFVEREHAKLDGILGNIVPEPIDVGEYVFNDYKPLLDMSELCVIVAIVDVENETSGKVYDGVYGAATLWAYPRNSVSSINGKINEYAQQSDAIIAIYMCPQVFVNGGNVPSEGIEIPGQEKGGFQWVSGDMLSQDATIDGYTPRNKKLYSYPFNFYHVDNANGSALTLRYEFMKNRTPNLFIAGTITQPVQVVCYPGNYKGVEGLYTLNTETLSLNNFPMCSWNVDAYQAWVAQNAIPTAMSIGSNLATGAVGGALMGGGVGTAVGLGASVISQVTSAASQWYKASIAADICKGNFNNGGVNVANGKQQFYGGRVSINAQTARRIDQYFDMFGYAVNAVRIPNTHSRPHWNYVKTIGATITGSVPCDDMKRICEIHDSGITYWKKGSEVGNYSLDNTV